MRTLDFRVLVLHYRKYVRRKILLEHPFVVFESRVFTTFAFCDDGFIASARYHGLDIDPSPMKRGRDAPAIYRSSAKLPDLGLKLGSKLRALIRTLIEKTAELR